MTDPVDTDALRETADRSRAGRSAFGLRNIRGELEDALRAAVGEVDRLRAVIENAPHAYECFADFAPGSKCTCWKADAL